MAQKEATSLGIAFLATKEADNSSTKVPASVTVKVNGTKVKFSLPPIEDFGTLVAPIKPVLDAMKVSIIAINTLEYASTMGDNTVVYGVDNYDMIVNGKTVPLDMAPYLFGSTVYCPIVDIAKALGAKVKYDTKSRTLNITCSPNVDIEERRYKIAPAVNESNAIGISSGSTKEGASAITWSYLASKNQKFDIIKVDGGYIFKNVNSGKVLT
ncbi:MAG: stalk domain-containing protein, partial [Niameybacter sp.]